MAHQSWTVDHGVADMASSTDRQSAPANAAMKVSETFLTLDFSTIPRSELIKSIEAMGNDGAYHYLVTPNVDHMQRYLDGSVDPTLYTDADVLVCDSRILQRLALLRGKRLTLHNGADVVLDLMNRPKGGGKRIAVAGPSDAEFARLQTIYPDHDLVFINVPHVSVGDDKWNACLDAVAEKDWDILMVCISSPKQEYFARDLRSRRRSGIALCVGASIDFLTGAQTRAPLFMQKLGLEWLFRLLSQPKRMWRRYLVEGPRIFPAFLRYEILGQKPKSQAGQ